MLIIDKYAYQSRWRSVSPARKGGLLLVLLLACALPSNALHWGLFVMIAILTCRVSYIAPGQYLRWLAIPLSFLLLSIATILLSAAHQQADFLVSVPLGSIYIGVHPQSLAMAHATLARCLATLASTLFFVLTTPFDQILILLRRLRLPAVLIEQVLLIYRFIFIFIEESHAIYCAQTLRFGYANRRVWLKSLGNLASMLFARVIERHEQMQATLAVKLYQGEFHL